MKSLSYMAKQVLPFPQEAGQLIQWVLGEVVIADSN